MDIQDVAISVALWCVCYVLIGTAFTIILLARTESRPRVNIPTAILFLPLYPVCAPLNWALQKLKRQQPQRELINEQVIVDYPLRTQV